MKFPPIDQARRVRHVAVAALFLLLTVTAARASDDRVVVLTSYPEELTARYQTEFERRHPGARVEILWRQSADALAWLRSGGAGQVDVYWTPSPGNFIRLRDEGHFARLGLDGDALPATIAGFPIGDPDGHFAAFELAGYGIAYNVHAVDRLGLPPPADWADLAAPGYAGQLELPIPGRVGFAPVLIEAVLQAHGWERGWALLAEIAANTVFENDAGAGVDSVASGERAARLTIDFFAAAAIADGAPMRFVYPPKTAFNPAQIAVFKAAPHPEMARRFVQFALSAEGQALLLDPDVRRLPVRRDLYTTHPELGVQPFAAGNLAYDGELTQARRGLVAALFEAALVAPHAERAPLWRALRAAEQAGRGDEPTIREARTLLTTVPVAASGAADTALRALFAEHHRQPAETDTPPARAGVEARWATGIASRTAAARALLAP